MLEFGADDHQGRRLMRFGINLRGDLAKLDDAEIASRFEELVSETETKYRAIPACARNKWFHRGAVGFLFGRGLLHARVFYKIQAVVFGCFLLISGNDLLTPESIDLYLLDCELKDTRDEIKRRVGRQRAVGATS
jgi:hypothetical protein